jgi:hypothetical protein
VAAVDHTSTETTHIIQRKENALHKGDSDDDDDDNNNNSKGETESTAVAAQDQAISTNCFKTNFEGRN